MYCKIQEQVKAFDFQTTAKTHQWWKPKASSLLTILYCVMLVGGLPFPASFILFLPSLITIVGIGSFGHFINDWYDIEADHRAGKANKFASLPAWLQRLVVWGALVVALLPWTILPFDRLSIILLLIEFLLLLLYAIPPFRIKERIVWPILTDAAYAYAVPGLLAAHTFFLAGATVYDGLYLVLLFLWQLCLGIRHFLNHVALDRNNDIVSHTQTLATLKGNRFIHRIIRRIVLPLEVLCFGFFLFNFSHYHVPLVVSCVILFIIFTGFPLVLALGRGYSFFSYRFSHTALDGFYQNLLPFLPLVFLVLGDVRFVVLLFVHVLLFYKIDRRFIPDVGNPPRALPIRYLFYWPFMVVVGYPVLLFNKFFIGSNANFVTTPDGVQTSSTAATVGKRESFQHNIALANTNKSKYTETFINELVPHLKFNVYYLYGGEVPLYDHAGRHFLSNWGSLQSLSFLLQSIFQLDQKYYLKNSIAAYLQSSQVKLVLAEFGPVGSALAPITRDLGIPLVVYFHGYDVFHAPTWDAHAEGYRTLFREAEKILVVSSLMAEHLKRHGAVPEKLVHLPAYVNLALFPYQDRSRHPPHFVYVGRFTETKSPHLTILAFQKVQEVIPEARLTMVGKGGGGELFEACVILVRALGLEGKIFFEGALPHDGVAGVMAGGRVLLLHAVTTPETHDMEGKPVVIMEAMASGMPVIATRHSGITELVTHGIDGLLIDEYDLQGMVDAMILLVRNDSLVKTLGVNASRRIREDPLIRDHIAVLESIICGCIHR